jgi:hypothetical protein
MGLMELHSVGQRLIHCGSVFRNILCRNLLWSLLLLRRCLCLLLGSVFELLHRRTGAQALGKLPIEGVDHRGRVSKGKSLLDLSKNSSVTEAPAILSEGVLLGVESAVDFRLDLLAGVAYSNAAFLLKGSCIDGGITRARFEEGEVRGEEGRVDLALCDVGKEEGAVMKVFVVLEPGSGIVD